VKKNDHHLIQRVLDGDVTPEAFGDFQERLREEPELLELYGQYALLQNALCEEFEGGHAIGMLPMASGRRIVRFPAAVAIAAVLTLLAALWFTRPWVAAKAADDAAALTFSVDAAWRIEGSHRSIGGATAVGGGSVLHLECGRAAVWLSPSVTALVEGPAELTFRSKEQLFMKSGKGYFTIGGNGEALTLDTPRMTASDFGAEFGIEVPVDGADELLVSEGSLRVASKAGNETVLLRAGDAAQIPATGAIGRFPADGRRFAKEMGRFRSVVSLGDPQISPSQTDAGSYSNLLRLAEPVPGSGSSVLLTTLDIGKSPEEEPNTDGWASMGFFSKGSEVLHFGNSASTAAQVIVPERPVNGLRTVTLRYDPRTGDVSLHEGGLPLGNLICSGKIPPGSEFDEIRLGASSVAALAVNALDIRVGGD
jgi:hypothetical protein